LTTLNLQRSRATELLLRLL